MLAQHATTGLWRGCLTAVSALLSLLLLGHVAGFALDILARRWQSLRRWNFDTVCPGSFRELLALFNKFNWRHVKVVGYNNGVNHFGQRYPGETIVSTVNCNRAILHQRHEMAGRRRAPNHSSPAPGRSLRAPSLKADCGTTVRQALDVLGKADLELPVVPNYSYVCLGTAFFIPIHGSAADFSTVADTITRVLLYDPMQDRFISATSDEPAFRNHVYNLHANVVLLRLFLQVKPRSRYYVHKEVLNNPRSGELLDALRDGRATNVEIRKSSASTNKVTVSKYYKDPGAFAVPGARTPPRWSRQAMGPTGGERRYLVLDARSDSSLCLSPRTVLYGRGIRGVLGDPSSAAAPQAPTPLYQARRLAALSIPGARLRCRGPIYAAPPPAPIPDLPQARFSRRATLTPASTAGESACHSAAFSWNLSSKSCG